MNSAIKAFAMTDAKIQFVSLVDKAANRRRFLITKTEGGQATFSTFGRIVKADADNHYITGIVYEPLVEDTDGNYMTEDEILKAAYWFAKNGDSVDIQHSFDPLPGAAVVENWVAKADFTIDEEPIQKGTWLMTVEVADADVWEAVKKGDITGFSMGGLCRYSEEDVDLSAVAKTPTETGGAHDAERERRGVFKKLAELLGFDVAEKGAMADTYAARSKASRFWNAFSSLEDALYGYNRFADKWEFESDENAIREALAEFSTIVQDILGAQNVAKALTADHSAMEALEKRKEARQVTKTEIEKMITDGVAAAIAKATNPEPAAAPEGAPAAAPPPAQEAVTPESIEKMVAEAIEKALKPAEDALTPDAVEKMVAAAVAQAVEPILKSRGLPSNLNGDQTVEKAGEAHFLAGIL